MTQMVEKQATPATYAAPAKMMRPAYEPPLLCKICPAIGTPVSALCDKLVIVLIALYGMGRGVAEYLPKAHNRVYSRIVAAVVIRRAVFTHAYGYQTNVAAARKAKDDGEDDDGGNIVLSRQPDGKHGHDA